MRLARITGRQVPEFLKSETKAIQQTPLLTVPNSYFERVSLTITMDKTLNHGFILEEDQARNRMYVRGAKPRSNAARIMKQFKRIKGSWLLSIHGYHVHNQSELDETLKDLQAEGSTDTIPTNDGSTTQRNADPACHDTTVTWVFAPDRTLRRHLLPTDVTLLDMDQLAAIQRVLKRVQHHQRNVEVELTSRRKATDAPGTTSDNQAPDSGRVHDSGRVTAPGRVKTQRLPSPMLTRKRKQGQQRIKGKTTSATKDLPQEEATSKQIQNPAPSEHALQQQQGKCKTPKTSTPTTTPKTTAPQITIEVIPSHQEQELSTSTTNDQPPNVIRDIPSVETSQLPGAIPYLPGELTNQGVAVAHVLNFPSFPTYQEPDRIIEQQVAIATATNTSLSTAPDSIPSDAHQQLNLAETLNCMFGSESDLPQEEMQLHLNHLLQQDPAEMEAQLQDILKDNSRSPSTDDIEWSENKVKYAMSIMNLIIDNDEDKCTEDEIPYFMAQLNNWTDKQFSDYMGTAHQMQAPNLDNKKANLKRKDLMKRPDWPQWKESE